MVWMEVTNTRLGMMVRPVCVVGFGLALSACVSDTLSNTNTQSEPPSLSQIQAENPDVDPLQRQQAIAEIRQKQNASGSDQLTNAYAEANGLNEPFTQEEKNSKIEALEQNAAQNDIKVGDAELEARQRKLKVLQNKAKTHYDSAVNSIEN